MPNKIKAFIATLFLLSLTPHSYGASTAYPTDGDDMYTGGGGGAGGVRDGDDGGILPPNMGFYNNDLTCFINSSIQIFFHLAPFRQFLDEERKKFI